jgi:plastocyanin
VKATVLVAALAATVVAAVLLAGTGAPEAQQGPAGNSIDVRLSELRFAPNGLEARVGVPLTVRLVNDSQHAHDVYFPSMHMPGLAGAQTYVKPGETTTLTLMFEREGVHTFGCSQPRHAGAGMTGAVFVRP